MPLFIHRGELLEVRVPLLHGVVEPLLGGLLSPPTTFSSSASMVSRTATKFPRRMAVGRGLPAEIWAKAVHMSGFFLKWSVA